MPTFPSHEWMQAYAGVVQAHPSAADLADALEGRYRFVITAGGGFSREQAHDLLVRAGPDIQAAETDYETPTDLTVTADYPRWRGLITGQSDFVMSFLMRRIRVEGNINGLRSKVSDARPLLDCLRRVSTDFPF